MLPMRDPLTYTVIHFMVATATMAYRVLALQAKGMVWVRNHCEAPSPTSTRIPRPWTKLESFISNEKSPAARVLKIERSPCTRPVSTHGSTLNGPWYDCDPGLLLA